MYCLGVITLHNCWGKEEEIITILIRTDSEEVALMVFGMTGCLFLVCPISSMPRKLLPIQALVKRFAPGVQSPMTATKSFYFGDLWRDYGSSIGLIKSSWQVDGISFQGRRVSPRRAETNSEWRKTITIWGTGGEVGVTSGSSFPSSHHW